MSNNKKSDMILFIIGVLIISSTLIIMYDFNEKNTLREKALSSSDAFNWSALPSYGKGATVSPEDKTSLKIMSEAVNAKAISWHELALRHTAFSSMEKLRCENNTSIQETKNCLKIIKMARESHVIEDSKIDVGIDNTINEMALNGWV